MKDKIVSKLSKSMLAVVIILALGTTLAFNAFQKTHTEYLLNDMVRTGGISEMNGEKLIVTTADRVNTNGYYFRETFIDGVKTTYMIKAPSFIEALSYTLIPAIAAIFALMLYADREAEEISKEYSIPLSSMIKRLENIMAGRLDDEEDEEVIANFKKQVDDLGGNSENILNAFKVLKENQIIRRDFSANVTHELKSPLTSINGYAEMIASGMTSEEDSRRFAAIIHKEGIRLLQMINETIQLSKFDSGNDKYEEYCHFDIKPVIDEIVSSIIAYAIERNVNIVIDGNNASMYGNMRLISDCFRNIISNAIKYSKKSGGKLDISIQEDLDDVILKFADDGIGMELEDQNRIFERFYVVDKSRGNKTGTGLGLSLVKHIVEQHKGSIVVKSSLGVGSTFVIRFPKNLKEQLELDNNSNNKEVSKTSSDEIKYDSSGKDENN